MEDSVFYVYEELVDHTKGKAFVDRKRTKGFQRKQARTGSNEQEQEERRVQSSQEQERVGGNGSGIFHGPLYASEVSLSFLATIWSMRFCNDDTNAGVSADRLA